MSMRLATVCVVGVVVAAILVGGRAFGEPQAPGPASATSIDMADWQVVDLAQWLANQPIMARFDATTHRFRGTPGEFRATTAIGERLAAIEAELASLASAERRLLTTAMGNSADADEGSFWQGARQLRNRQEQLMRERVIEDAALMAEGRTPAETVVPFVDALVSGLWREFSQPVPAASQSAAAHRIVLNRLPVDHRRPPRLSSPNPFAAFLAGGSVECLRDYLAEAPAMAPLFPGVDSPVLCVFPHRNR